MLTSFTPFMKDNLKQTAQIYQEKTQQKALSLIALMVASPFEQLNKLAL